MKNVDTPDVNAELLPDLAYIMGAALGDGNLSNPNGRATRLRITCAAVYPEIAKEMENALKRLLPKNKVSRVYIPGYSAIFNISVYSNKFEKWFPWNCRDGTKQKQKAHVPSWIFLEERYITACLKGLIQTDGSIYIDRGYKMVNFTNNVKLLIDDTVFMLQTIGFSPTVSKAKNSSGRTKYTVRVARNTENLIKKLNIKKW